PPALPTRDGRVQTAGSAERRRGVRPHRRVLASRRPRRAGCRQQRCAGGRRRSTRKSAGKDVRSYGCQPAAPVAPARARRAGGGARSGPARAGATLTMLEPPKVGITGVPAQAPAPTVSGNNVTLHFNSAQYTGLFPILGNTYILKASVAQQIAANPTMTITNPV